MYCMCKLGIVDQVNQFRYTGSGFKVKCLTWQRAAHVMGEKEQTRKDDLEFQLQSQIWLLTPPPPETNTAMIATSLSSLLVLFLSVQQGRSFL